MGNKEFLELVEEKCPEALKQYIPQGWEILKSDYEEEIKKNGRRLVGRFIGMLEQLRPLFAQPEENVTLFSKITPGVEITSDFLADKIFDWVKLLRKELFNSEDAPFKTLQEVQDWFTQEVKREPSFQGQIDWNEYEEAYLHLTRAYKNRVFTMPMDIGRTIGYIGADGKRHYAGISGPPPMKWKIPIEREGELQANHSKLSWLENETRMMSEATGFEQLSIIDFTLRGTRPILPRYSVTGLKGYRITPFGEYLFPLHINIDIWAKDLRFDELVEIYKGTRNILKLTNTKQFKKKAVDLYQVVSQKGGPVSGKGSSKFWEGIRMSGIKNRQREKYKDWRSVKHAYDRIAKKLNDKEEDK
jgi:hypothetical protein